MKLRINRTALVVLIILCIAVVVSAVAVASWVLNKEARARQFLEEGRALAEAGQIDSAIIQYMNAVRYDPDNISAHIELGDLYVKNGDLNNAYRYYRDASERDPRNVEALWKLAECYHIAGQWDDVQRTAARLVSLAPGGAIQAMAHQYLARAYYVEGDYERAASEFTRVGTYDPSNLDAILALALVEAQHLMRQEQAEVTLGRLQEIAGDDSADEARRAEAAVRTARFYATVGQPQDALDYYRKAIELQGSNPAYWVALGDFYKAAGRDAHNLSQAEGAYKKALEVRPTDPEALLSLGLLYKETGRSSSVVEIFERGIAAGEASAYHQVFYQHLIEALIGRSDLDGAWRRLEGLRKLPQADDVADYLEGRIHMAQAEGVDENLLRAEQLFGRVIRAKPRFPMAYYYRGLSLAARGMLEDASEDFQRTLALVADFPDARVALAETYMKMREFDRAAAEARFVLEHDTNNYHANLIAGRALRARDNLTGALSFLEQARSIKPSSHEPYIALADLHAARDEWDRALAVLAEGERFTDDPGRLRSALAMLEHRRGSSDEAIRIAYSLVQDRPSDAAAAAFYVSMLWRDGRADDALDFITSRIERYPSNAAFHTLMGSLMLSLGRNERAFQAYSRGLEIAETDREALAGAAEALINMGRHDQAREMILRLDKADPGSSTGHLLEARILEEEGMLAAAATLLETSLRQNSSNAQAHYRLAMVRKAAGELDKAIESLQASLRHNPSSVPARLELAELYYQTRYFDDALREAGLARSHSGDDPLLLSRAATIATGSLLEHERIEDAITEWTALPAEIRDGGDYALKLGHLYALNNQLDDAEESFRRAAEVLDDPAPALEGLARIFMTRQRYEEALTQANAALAAGGDPSTRLRLLQIVAAVNVARGQHEYALDALARVREAAGADATLLIQAGDSFMALDDPDRTLEAYQSAVAADPDSMTAVKRLVAAHERAGRFSDAERIADDLLARRPGDFDAMVMKGRVLMGQQRYREAATILDRSISDSDVPARELAAARFLLAQAHYHSGLLPAAETQLRRTLAQMGDFTPARLMLAEVLLRGGSFEQAAAAASAVVNADPENPRAWAIKADAAKLAGDVEASIGDYHRALDLERNAGTLLALIDAYERLGRAGEAERLLEEYVREDPTDATTAWMLGRIWVARDRIDEAEAVLKQALETNRADERLRGLLADIYRRSDRLDEAIALMKESLAERPSPETFRALAALESIAGDDEAAEATFRAGIAEFPDFLQGYIDLANLVSSQDDFSRGVDVLQSGLESNPDNEAFYEAMASFYIRLTRNSDAERFITDTLDRRPHFAALACMLGDLRYVSGRRDEALTAYEHALRYASGDVRARAANAVAWVLTEKGQNLTRAVELADEASVLKPDDPDILDTLGWAYYKTRQYNRAVVTLARAVELSREPSSQMLYHLALAYRDAGMLASAQDTARRAIAADASLAADSDIEALIALE